MENLLQELQGAQTLEALESIRIKALGKKGIITEQFVQLKTLTGEEKSI